MRSRYSAFVLRDKDYLLATWHRSVRPPSLELDPNLRWVGLNIRSRTGGGLFDKRGTVSFVATYRSGGTAHILTENSLFIREDGHWFYLGVAKN